MSATDYISPMQFPVHVQFPPQADVSSIRGAEVPDAVTPVFDGNSYPYETGDPVNATNLTSVAPLGMNF